MKEPLLSPSGGYRKLISYQKAEAVYDLTYYFCANYLKRGDSTIDQMVQAARSGKQNIAEGSAASATSKETEIKLMNVAKASLDELLLDYEDYLRTRNHAIWEANSKEVTAMRKLGKEHNNGAFYVQLAQTRPPETIANMAISLINQSTYLLRRQINVLGEAFLKEGGFRERMTRLRIEERKKGNN
ncbi:MAG: four helix bundle suffix domain-containing protein [Bacteroidota bacterium]